MPFLPKAKELFPEKGPECLYVLVKSGAQGYPVKKPVHSILLPRSMTTIITEGKLPPLLETSNLYLYNGIKCPLSTTARDVGQGDWCGPPEEMAFVGERVALWQDLRRRGWDVELT